jgi:hypothetical protein
MILTKPLGCLGPSFLDYTNLLAELGAYPVNKVKCVVWTIHTTISPDVETSDTTDPRLGTRIDLEQRWKFPK